MKAGDIKKFLDQAILSERRDSLNPSDFKIHDPYLLGVITAYKNGEPPEHIKTMIEGFITTEELTVARRVAVLKMVRAIFVGLSKPDVTSDDRRRLHSITKAYFI